MSNEKTVMVQILGDGAAALEGISGPVVGKRFALSAGTFIIGREDNADLSLPDDSGLSRVHAKIVADGDHYKIIDNESRNGTLVNDKPVRSIHLFDGDILRIGSCTLRFSQASARRPPEVTAITQPDRLAPRAPPGPTAPMQAPAAPALAPWIMGVAAASVIALVLVAIAVGIFIGRGDAAVDAPVAVAPAAPARIAPAPAPDVALPAALAPAALAALAADAGTIAPVDVPFVPARFVAGVDDVVRIKVGGKVESVDVKDGDSVEKGALLAVVVGVGASAADIATRKESITALESVAESNARAAKQLAEERAALQTLLAQTTKLKVVAPATGTVQQLVLVVGETVRSSQVVARIVGAPSRAEIDVDASAAARLEPGAVCELKLKEGVAQGTLREKRGTTLSIEPSPRDVVSARCH